MLETKEQKQIFFICAALILALVGFSLYNRIPSPPTPKTTNVANQNIDLYNSKAYLDYFAAANIDRVASKELMQTILTKEDITKEVEKDLQVDQKIIPPQVDESKLKIEKQNTEEKLNRYLSNSVSEAFSFSKNFAGTAGNLFGSDKTAAEQIEPELTGLTQKLYSMSVPSEAVDMHKSLIQAYTAYEDLIKVSKGFKADQLEGNDEVWPQVYKNYAIINDSTRSYSEQLTKIATKYNIAYVDVYPKYAEQTDDRPMVLKMAIPSAQAGTRLPWAYCPMPASSISFISWIMPP